MEMSKSNDLIVTKDLVPQPQQQYRSWELGVQMVNHKKLTDFYQPNRIWWINSDCISDVLPKLTFINDKFVFCHTFFSKILLIQVKFCNNVANN